MLGAMEIFKYLPASKKAENSNCKACGCPTCMMFSLKLSKGQITIDKCPHAPLELVEKVSEAVKIQQKAVEFGGKKFGGEKVMFRHEKTFINPTGFFASIDVSEPDYLEKYIRIRNFEIEVIGKTFKFDGIYIKNSENLPIDNFISQVRNDGFIPLQESDLGLFQTFEITSIAETSNLIEKLTNVRYEAVVNRNETYSDPILTFVNAQNPLDICAIGSSLVCKYSSVIVFDCIDEAVVSSLVTLRLNIFTDPELPLKVDSKVYEFNNPNENSFVFLTTNFALTYFAVANELSQLKRSSYLVVTPSEGMSVLTAWSAEKITAQIASKIVRESKVLETIKNKKLIIPGYLADLQEELQEELPEWEVIIGTKEAYQIPAAVREYNW